jgi:Ca-activated chloride channel family protein
MKDWIKRLLGPTPSALAVTLLAAGYCLSSADCRLLRADQRGLRAFERGDFTQAAETFTDPQWRAAALYRAGEFEQAANIFAGFDSAEGAFNQANALVMQGQYEAAIERYTRALEHRPGWTEAETNLAIARSRAEQLKKQGGDMTGGMLGADEYKITSGKSPKSGGEEQVEAEQTGLGNETELRAVWLRQVQTRPADFLRAKFAQQEAMRRAEGNQP